MNRKLTLALPLLLVALPLSAAQKLTISWSGAEVIVSGVTPHGQISLIAIMRSRDEYRGRVFRANEQLTDDDGDGVIRYQTPSDTALTSAAVAVDERTGDYAIGSRESAAPMMPVPAFEIGRDSNGNGVELHLKAHYAQAAVVRPGRGSWRGSFEAAGKRGSDGQFRVGMFIPVSKLTPRQGGQPAPDFLEINDLIVAIDEQPLQVLVYRETARP